MTVPPIIKNIPKNIPVYGWLFAVAVFVADIVYKSYSDSYDLKAQVTSIKRELKAANDRLDRVEYNLDAAARIICAGTKVQFVTVSGLDCKSPHPLPNP